MKPKFMSLRKKAAIGDMDVRRELAFNLICETGDECSKREGLKILEEMSDSGDYHAKGILGYALSLRYICNPVDLERSKQLITESAEAGSGYGEGIIAEKLFRGDDLFEHDPILAHYYMQKGVEHGDERAIRMKELRDIRLNHLLELE